MITLNSYTRVIKEYENISFRYTKGKIDVFYNKQFHSYYEIYLFLNGKAEFLNDHSKRELKINNLIIIPPGEYHCFIADEDYIENYERCVLNIPIDFLDTEILKTAFGEKEILDLSANHRIVENFNYLRNSAEKTNEKDFKYILAAIATDIIFLIKQCHATKENYARGSLRPISVEIMEYINKNYKSDITLESIANNFSFSVSSISHIFKKDFGISIKKYITEKRMNEIYMLLQKGEKPSAIASCFGFSNYSTFYRSFKSYFGKAPFEIKNTFLLK